MGNFISTASLGLTRVEEDVKAVYVLTRSVVYHANRTRHKSQINNFC